MVWEEISNLYASTRSDGMYNPMVQYDEANSAGNPDDVMSSNV